MINEENEYDISCKVVLVGESGVGKTCITNRFLKGTFRDEEAPTASATYAEKILNIENKQKTIKFDIWDTAGQEKYRAIGNFFYKDANVAILVYDITNRKSFDEIQNYWINEIIQKAPENINKFLLLIKFL